MGGQVTNGEARELAADKPPTDVVAVLSLIGVDLSTVHVNRMEQKADGLIKWERRGPDGHPSLPKRSSELADTRCKRRCLL